MMEKSEIIEGKSKTLLFNDVSVKEITISRGRTINLGNYNSMKVDITITSRVDPGDEPNRVLEVLSKDVLLALKAEAEKKLLLEDDRW